jgi:STE24 endopeptidase
MVGSLLLLLVLFGPMGRWEGLVLLGWLASGAAVFTRVGERVAVRLGCGFRRPPATQAAVLAPLWSVALRSCDVAPGEVDLYAQHTRDPNAYAAGGRSIAVTTGFSRNFKHIGWPRTTSSPCLVMSLGTMPPAPPGSCW